MSIQKMMLYVAHVCSVTCEHCQQEQRLVGVVDEDESVDLVTARVALIDGLDAARGG